jgi:hypothetical protein
MLICRYSIFGHEYSFGPQKNPPKPEDHEFATKQYKKLAELLAAGQFKPNPVKKYPKGLAGVEEGFKDAQAGKVTSQHAHY